jgi:acetyltransferase-like isoleucine patch superfamily enzyme
LIRRLAERHPSAVPLYRRFGRPNAREWAEFLRRQGRVYHIGEGCSILPSAQLVDPPYTWIGNRVNLGSCTLICHDGSIAVPFQVFGARLDRVAPIIIHDDVFVGENALLLGGTTIGAGSIIGAGSVVRQTIPPGSVVMGNPAKVVGTLENLVRFWEADTMVLPWADLIAARNGTFDAAMEPELMRRRQAFFFKDVP